MHYIDLRSDTVTQPTLAMRAAMAAAEVGDDVYGDDTTMNELEALAAQMLGKEAAMFATSGTMGNQIGIMSQTRRGDEIIAGAESHIVMHEVGRGGGAQRRERKADRLPQLHTRAGDDSRAHKAKRYTRTAHGAYMP